MGLQSLQEFVDNSGEFSTQLTTYLEKTSRETSNLLLVHADTCVRRFYHENIDWVCGGQWSELFQCIEKFVHAFRQSDIELVIFFDGSLNHKTKTQWVTKHGSIREFVKDTLSLVVHNNNIPFRSKTRNFVPPGALKAAIRLAFRACDVLVCSSIEDIFKETILYCKDQNCIGIIGNDSNYLLYKAPSYISIGSTRWLKKILAACNVYNSKAVLKELNLKRDDLPYLAALIGNHALSDNNLSSFFWDLIEEDNPLKKVKENLTSDAVLPPGFMRLKCVAKFIHDNRDSIENIDKLADIVFHNSKTITVNEGKEKLKEVITYYKEALKVSRASPDIHEGSEPREWLASGFPTHHLQDIVAQTQRYKNKWKFVDKTKQLSANLKKVNLKKNESTCTNIDDPEKVLKEGTLEEAAQALEQIERKESEAELNIAQSEVPEQSKSVEDASSSVIVDDEKPPADVEIEASENKDTDTLPISEIDFDEEDDEEIEYPRAITVTPVLPSIERDVLKIACTRHQSGQMCPEVLNLLSHGEIIINMTLDDEMANQRHPIPLIYRPLRQLIYGVLFGAKQHNENDSASKDDVSATTSAAAAEQDDSETEVIVNGTSDVIEDEEKDKHVDNQPAADPNVEEDEKKEQQVTEEVEENVFKVKEWCVYGERDIENPDHVLPKGMSWGIPSLKKLWLGTDSEDNANRLKAFLSCMKSDTVNMSNTAMVPQRLMLLCCVLRYLIQQDSKNSVLSKQDIDAFLAQALSAHLTTEHNSQNLANLKLNQVDARCIQLAAIFMSGIHNAVIANDACGAPVPWEFCCPWNFFDGKLFHSKWLQATMNFNMIDLCDGKPHMAEKLERLRWCVTEGLDSKYNITGFEQTNKFVSPFGAPMQQARPLYGVMRPAGAYPMRGRSRGNASRRAVHGSGGTLHVAGVPVAHWGGNKSGFGYSKNAPTVLVGGPNSVVLPSNQKRRGGHGANQKTGGGVPRYFNAGRGLLETPYISPWQQGYGYEEVQNVNFQRYMKGVHKAEQVRTNLRKIQPPSSSSVSSSTTQHQLYNANASRTTTTTTTTTTTRHNHHYQQQQQQQHQNRYGNYPHSATNKPESYTKNMWLGKGRGQQQQSSMNNFLSQSTSSSSPSTTHYPTPIGGRTHQSTAGRGQWMNTME